MMKNKWLFSITFILLLFCIDAKAQSKKGDQIVFLNLKIIQGNISLEGINIVNGRLKRHKYMSFVKGHFYFKVLNQTDETLYESVMPDPSHSRYEYEDENGMLRSKAVVLDSLNFSVRLPYDESIYKVEFYKISTIPKDNQFTAKAINQIGSFLIDLKKNKDE